MSDSGTERDPLEVLAAEYTDRLRKGQRPGIEEYCARHPELAEGVRELFPTIAAAEQLKARQTRSSGGRATLGPARLERLGDFRLIREIGCGGMGVVFEAEQESLGRRVAVKVLPRQMLLDEKHLKRFEREARIAAHLHHTNIVEVFGVGEQDGFHYYVMQYIRGVGLEAVIPALARLRTPTEVRRSSGAEVSEPPPPRLGDDQGVTSSAAAEAIASQLLGGPEGLHADGRLGPSYWQSVARLGLQAADALGYAHSQGTLHRDIKPANLLLDAQGTVWLADFGLAKAAQSDNLSLANEIVGTLRYMAPEQFRGTTDPRADVYSLGLTLYELLTLRPAYDETDQSRLIQQIAQGAPLAPGATTRGIPRDLETIVLKAISHEAAQRYPSAREMAEDLRRFLEDRPISARRASATERLVRWCRRNRSLAALSGTSLVLLVLVAMVTSLGYARTKQALRGESSERTRAETNAALAIEALDRIFDRLSPTRIVLVPKLPAEGVKGEAIEIPSSPVLSRESAAILEEMLPFYDRLARQGENNVTLRAETAQANQRVGAIRQRLGRVDEAIRAYRRALALYKEWDPGVPAHPKPSLNAAQIENELGLLYTSRRQETEARQSHLAALVLLQPNAAFNSAPADWRFELARTYYFLGIPERPLPTVVPPSSRPVRIPEPDRANLGKAVVLLTSLADAVPGNPEYQHLLALCYLEGAPADPFRGSETRRGGDRAIEILDRLVKTFPEVPDYAYDLSEAYARIHIPQPPIPLSLQQTIEGRFGKSLALVEKLASDHPDIPDFLAAQARMYHRIGSFQKQMERWDDAAQSFRKAVVIQAPLVERFPNSPSYGLWMATFRIALGDALTRRNKTAEARAELEATVAALSRQLAQGPDRRSLHELLALAYSRLEIALRQSGNQILAAEAGWQAERERNSLRRAP